MIKFLYIDGENVNTETIVDFVENFSRDLKDSDRIVGKLYGNRDQVKRSIPFCWEHGFSYVETSTISTSRKNIADMKLIVDCMADVIYSVATSKRLEVDSVTILSKDADFLPLVYKLREVGVKVQLPLYTGEDTDSTANLDAFLKQVGFYSGVSQNVNTGILFQEIKRVCELGKENGYSSDFSDDTIADHVALKTRKFYAAVGERIYGDSAFTDFTMNPREFSLAKVLLKTGIRDLETIDFIYLLYVTKVFGFIPKYKYTPGSVLTEIGVSRL